jgi:hypothetical protein
MLTTPNIISMITVPSESLSSLLSSARGYKVQAHVEVDLYNTPEDASSTSTNDPSPLVESRIRAPSAEKAFIKVSSQNFFEDSGRVSSLDRRSCYVCHSRSTSQCSKCTKVFYCSRPCQVAHWRYHKLTCSAAAKTESSVSSSSSSSSSIISSISNKIRGRGKVGLLNIGNSCYLSSSLQCLSHIKEISAHLLSERYQAALSSTDAASTGHSLLTEYCNLLKELWLANKQTTTPSGKMIVIESFLILLILFFILAIKRVLGQINSDYAGFQQHDAHEVHKKFHIIFSPEFQLFFFLKILGYHVTT